jgi:hypothetical protein
MILMNYENISRRDSSYTIKEFKELIFLPLLDIKYTVRNQWFGDVRKIFQHVIILGRLNILL